MRQSLILLFALLPLVAGAMDTGKAKPPTQDELIHLLSGNTMNGKWDGRPFTQYFAPGGSTRYREADGPASNGTWRVNSKGQYCSVWPPSPTEACYDVLIEDKTVLWKSGGKIHPSNVESGNTF